MKIIHAADLFCGAGGTSEGLIQATDELGMKLKLIAINHWPRAVETHSANHPTFEHLCAALSSVEPRKAVPTGKLNLLVASPECTHHSRARGGKPMNDQSRASAWHVLHWCEELNVENVLIENVKEFEEWGPIGANGRPLSSRKGETFKAFINALESLNYSVEWRVLNAADYGDATSRQRLFLRAARGRRQINWPNASHQKQHGQGHLFGGTSQPWRAARDIIDWSIPGTSIFTRKRPLKDSTIARIAAGIAKFWGEWAEPFLVLLRSMNDPKAHNRHVRRIGEPVPAITAGGNHVGLVEPFIVPQMSCGANRAVSQPVPTITTTSRGIALIQPLILSAGGPRVDAFPVTEPMNTVLTRDHMAIAEPFITKMANSSNGVQVREVSHPMPTITSADEFGVVRPFVVQYYGTGGAKRLEEPLDTVTARDRFGLVLPDNVHLDIRFRMLQPHELAAAMGFPSKYQFMGTRE